MIKIPGAESKIKNVHVVITTLQSVYQIAHIQISILVSMMSLLFHT